MARDNAFAAIDIGSTKIATLVGNVSERGQLRVVGVGVTPSAGVEKGQISDIAKAVEAIRSAVEKAERSSGTRIVSAGVGIAGTHLSSFNNRGIVAIPDQSGAISADDMHRVIDAGRNVSLKTNREMLHALPRYFVVDGQDQVTDPVGMHGQRLDVEMHIVTCGLNAMQNLVKCVESAGVQVDAVIATPVASAAVTLRPEEMREGVVLVDIGGGTTDIVVYQDGALQHTASLPVGGLNVTRDLVVGLRCPQNVAEEAKAAHGHALASEVTGAEEISLSTFGRESERTVPRRLLAEIVQARIEEILSMVMVEVKRGAHAEMASAGLVISGGCAEVEGMARLADRVVGLPARIGQVEEVYGLVDHVSGPAYAATLGLLHWLAEGQVPRRQTVRMRATPTLGVGAVVRRIGQVGRVFLPQ